MTTISSGSIVNLYRWTSGTPNPTAEARSALRRALDQTGLSAETIGDSVLATSELVANASEHAVGPYELRLRRTAAEFICEVLDHDPRLPEAPNPPSASPPEPGPHDCGGNLHASCALLPEQGRGLHIVHSLTSGRWGMHKLGDGAKVTWIALPLPHDGHRT
ncbi:ATP-binding protein [Streptomyces sp. NPDC048636]|uniref:ATP-binding protein n=1 Tax=Streptomyces sp. NPDC048636 TaxID=3155762 RepID=UPI0034237DF1